MICLDWKEKTRDLRYGMFATLATPPVIPSARLQGNRIKYSPLLPVSDYFNGLVTSRMKQWSEAIPVRTGLKAVPEVMDILRLTLCLAPGSSFLKRGTFFTDCKTAIHSGRFLPHGCFAQTVSGEALIIANNSDTYASGIAGSLRRFTDEHRADPAEALRRRIALTLKRVLLDRFLPEAGEAGELHVLFNFTHLFNDAVNLDGIVRGFFGTEEWMKDFIGKRLGLETEDVSASSKTGRIRFPVIRKDICEAVYRILLGKDLKKLEKERPEAFKAVYHDRCSNPLDESVAEGICKFYDTSIGQIDLDKYKMPTYPYMVDKAMAQEKRIKILKLKDEDATLLSRQVLDWVSKFPASESASVRGSGLKDLLIQVAELARWDDKTDGEYMKALQKLGAGLAGQAQ